MGLKKAISITQQVKMRVILTLTPTDMYDKNTRQVVGGLDFFEEVDGQMNPIRDKNGIYSTVSYF
jgi:hypothetical protein